MNHTGNTHSHSHNIHQGSASRLSLALGLTLVFVGIEALAGVAANSLALISDAGHNLTDAIALGLTWYAMRLSQKPANAIRTFGYHRAGILIALVNSTTLVAVAAGIFYEALHRFRSTPEVQTSILIVVGLLALAINAITAWLVRRGSDQDLNLRSAYIHLLGDVFSTVGAVAAGITIAFTGWSWLDPLVSVFIGLLIVWNAWLILRETVEILLESTPRDIDLNELLRDLEAIEGVHSVHDLHAWSLTKNLRAISAHIVIDDITISAGVAIQKEINKLINQRYNIGHATLQMECAGRDPDRLFCDMDDQHQPPKGG